MNPRRSILSISAVTAVLFLLHGCGSEDDPANTSMAGAPAGGSGVTMPGVSAGGAAGPSSAGSSVPPSTAGASMGGSAGVTPPAGTAGTASSVPATFDTIKLVLGGGGGIMPCAAAPCHGVNGMAPPTRPLELPPNDDDKLYANLTSYVSKACGEKKLVTPGNAGQSALVSILSGPCGMTPRMPYGCSADAGDCIPDEYIAAVSQWIANGAPRQ